MRAFVGIGIGLVVLWLAFLAVTSLLSDSHPTGGEIVLYCGRSQSLVEPLIEKFQKQSGIQVNIRSGKSAQLAMAIREEGRGSSADVFWAQDAAALSAVAQWFRPLPASLIRLVPAHFRDVMGTWVGTSGRARVLAYSTQRVRTEELPKSVFELADPKWKSRVGWAPTNASFQAFVTAMRRTHGDKVALRWLVGMRENGTRRYAKNTPILQALASGEIDLGLPNHYYLLRKKMVDRAYPVAQCFFEAGDVGNLINVAGVGILRTAHHPEAAERFVAFLLSEEAQRFFTDEVFEYPIVSAVAPRPDLLDQQQLLTIAPPVSLDDLDDLGNTLALLKEAGLL